MAIQILGTVPISQLPEIDVQLTLDEFFVVAKDIDSSPLNRLKNAREFAIETRDEAVNLAVPQAVGQTIALLPTLVPLPVKSTVFADEMVVVSGNPLLRFITTLQPHNFYVKHNTSAIGDNTRIVVILDTTMTYQLTAVYAGGGFGGQYDILVNGNSVLSIDAYSAAPTGNLSSTSSNFNVVAASVVIDVITTGQNGSSSGFDTNLTKIFIN